MNHLLLAVDTGGSYVAAAYLIFIVWLAVYLAIMARKLMRLQRSLEDVQRKVDERPGADDQTNG